MTFREQTAQLQLTSESDVLAAEVPGHSFRILADAAGTAGSYSLTVATSPAGAGVPPHAHDRCVECFYVLTGHYRLTVSGSTHEASAGGFVIVPRGSPHHFEVAGDEPGRAVVIFAPAGFEEVFRRMPEIFGTPGEPGHLWEQANAMVNTRLLGRMDDLRTGPAAITVASEHPSRRTDRPWPVSLTTLGTPELTRTPLAISLRSGPRDSTWPIHRSVSAIWIVTGSYRIAVGDSEVIASEGELVSFIRPGLGLASALGPANQALVLTL